MNVLFLNVTITVTDAEDPTDAYERVEAAFNDAGLFWTSDTYQSEGMSEPADTAELFS